MTSNDSIEHFSAITSENESFSDSDSEEKPIPNSKTPLKSNVDPNKKRRRVKIHKRIRVKKQNSTTTTKTSSINNKENNSIKSSSNPELFEESSYKNIALLSLGWCFTASELFIMISTTTLAAKDWKGNVSLYF
jgi:hypothetical protein